MPRDRRRQKPGGSSLSHPHLPDHITGSIEVPLSRRHNRAPSPHRERVGVRGSGLSLGRNPSPELLRNSTSPSGRGDAECAALTFPNERAAARCRRPEKFVRETITSSFRDGPKDQTRNLEIPGSML